MMYQEDAFVVLEPGKPEQLLSREEVLELLQEVLKPRQDDLPKDVRHYDTVEKQAQYLLESYCELELRPGYQLQWYVVRLEK
jgi:hypothetical protein